MFNKELLFQLIKDIEQNYLKFSETFYESNSNIYIEKIKNLKTYTVSNAMKSNYFMNFLIPEYHKSLEIQNVNAQFVVNYCKKEYKFHCRIKLMDSIINKLKHYKYIEQQKGSLYISKSLNDMWGARIILKDINNNIDEIHKIFDNLKSNDSLFKYVFRSKKGYRAIHCYFQSNNKYFPWELQIWDLDDEANNIRLHNEHEIDKLKY